MCSSWIRWQQGLATHVSQKQVCHYIHWFYQTYWPNYEQVKRTGIDSVAYYGEMDPKAQTESYMRWKSGYVNVMVAATAFGMALIDQIYVTLSDMEYPRVSAVGLRSLDMEVGMVLVRQCNQWPGWQCKGLESGTWKDKSDTLKTSIQWVLKILAVCNGRPSWKVS